MTKPEDDLPLFLCATTQPDRSSAEVIDFAHFANRSVRRRLGGMTDGVRALLWIDRQIGILPPTPVLDFPGRRA